MSINFTQLQCKEVICLCDGKRLGYVSDVQVEMPEGAIRAIVVPCPCKLAGLWRPQEEYCIPWCCVKKVGPDIILVDAKPEECRCARPKRPRLL